jgi:hypothetical protein
MRRSSVLVTSAAEAVCLSVAIAAGWLLIARPLQSRVDKASQEVRRAHAETARMTEVLNADPISPDEAKEVVAAHAKAIQAHCDLSSDPSALYEAIGELAKAEGVGIERMEPKKINVPAPGTVGGRATKSQKKATGAPSIAGIGYSIEVSGSYGSIAAFVDAIERRMGMSKVITIRLWPGQDPTMPDGVRGVVETAHFRLSKPLASAAGGE